MRRFIKFVRDVAYGALKIEKINAKIYNRHIEKFHRFDISNCSSVRRRVGTESRGHKFEFCLGRKIFSLCAILLFNNNV